MPTGWQAAVSPEGGVDLRVAGSSAQRAVLIAFTWAIAALWIGLAVLHVTHSPTFDLPMPMAAGLAIVLVAAAIWCTFASESWHLDRNTLEHRVGIGTWCHRRRYVDAELQIVRRFTGLNPTSIPYWRLYVVSEGAKHFLAERDQATLNDLQTFVAECTGWPVLQPDL